MYNFSSPSNCGVKPHLLAVLTTKTTLPLRLESGYGLPFLSLGLKSKKLVAEDMVLAWRSASVDGMERVFGVILDLEARRRRVGDRNDM